MVRHLWIDCPTQDCRRQVSGRLEVNYRIVTGEAFPVGELVSLHVAGKCDACGTSFAHPLSKTRVKLYRMR